MDHAAGAIKKGEGVAGDQCKSLRNCNGPIGFRLICQFAVNPHKFIYREMK